MKFDSIKRRLPYFAVALTALLIGALLGAAMIWLAVVRRTCDSDRVGVFAVRSCRFDMAFSTALGAALVWLSASVDALGS